ncbi:RagB/SusD family nutrient uptake outer membrane protein [Sinomicrobium soli]|uniref:RagB/SusD family nutrient uptake outer membrane protein n=1 Tax=Sinomicrobium sp. N-1-3-6 TaxID=2219864 RepID=UPI000DCD6F31|nr:RagB/SusD family nutrient uptake outer membrane protein [Sinomicrobium sp. N-1-3-6]RAV30557.1 RagB/SusD family nutrient uptake outer membrane protein [Sinomicrobium sp. N-1-3-6]
MTRTIRNNIKYLAVLLTVLAVSCEDLDLVPENTFTDKNYWTSAARAESMLNTAYSQLFTSGWFFYNEGLSDNAFNGRGDNEGAASIAAGTYDPSLGRIKNEWNERYKGIKSCNLLLENIDRVEEMDGGLRERYKAEARFIRAFQHFQLMTWFGDVPLLDKDPELTEAQTISRTPRTEVLNFILEELDAAAGVLPSNTEYAEKDRGRITRGAVMAFRARVLLYEGRWEEVVETCEALMQGNEYGSYSLYPSYDGLFLPENEYNAEDMLSLQYVPVERTWGEFFDMVPISAGARLNALAPTQELVDSYLMLNGKHIDEAGSGYDEDAPYENRDPRLTHTVVYHGYEWTEGDGSSHVINIEPGTGGTAKPDEYNPGSSASPTGYYIRKYYDPTHVDGMKSGLNLMLIRYADVLLMYAEAKNELGQLDETVWDNTIRALRERAGFEEAGALDFNSGPGQDGLREVIRNERRTELAMEGLRIFDIRRWRIAEEVLNGWAHGAKFDPASPDDGYIRANLRYFDPGKHYLWPVPRDERQINGNLSQNPNW